MLSELEKRQRAVDKVNCLVMKAEGKVQKHQAETCRQAALWARWEREAKQLRRRLDRAIARVGALAKEERLRRTRGRRPGSSTVGTDAADPPAPAANGS